MATTQFRDIDAEAKAAWPAAFAVVNSADFSEGEYELPTDEARYQASLLLIHLWAVGFSEPHIVRGPNGEFGMDTGNGVEFEVWEDGKTERFEWRNGEIVRRVECHFPILGFVVS
jgi:hypothetical protein